MWRHWRDEKLELEIDKLTRDREKLDVEITTLRRPWSLQAPYIAGILPIATLTAGAWIA